MIAYVDEKGNITPDPPDPEKKEEVKLEDIEISTPNKEELDPVRTGKVTFFDEAKGYGFIKDSETQQKIFIHVNNTLEEIHEGNMVNFEIGHGQKGPVALKVKIVEE